MSLKHILIFCSENAQINEFKQTIARSIIKLRTVLVRHVKSFVQFKYSDLLSLSSNTNG